MKKVFCLFIVCFLSLNSFSQKKKKSVLKATSANILAKSDNISAENINNTFYVFANNGKQKDTLSKKSIINAPTDCKLSNFSAKGNKLYSLTWIEKITTQSTNKSEEKTLNNTEIFDTKLKAKVFSNIQTVTKITEKVFLDKLKNASETQERMRNEGFVVSILPTGDLSLKTKTQENKMTYDIVAKKFIDIKGKK